jgi:hypothetical protein
MTFENKIDCSLKTMSEDKFVRTTVLFHLDPSIFNSVMNAVRPIMSKKTNDIFKTFGEESEWKGIVNELVDPNQLPPSYGGTKGTKKRTIVGAFQRESNGSWSWIPSWLR